MKPTVGEQLRSARETRGLTLEDAVKATNIRRAYLQELENDHPELLQSTAQAYGFLRLYTSFLGISFTPLIEQWESPKVESKSESILDNTDLPSNGEAQPTETQEAKGQNKADKVNQPELEPEKEKSSLSAGLHEALKRIPKLSQFLR